MSPQLSNIVLVMVTFKMERPVLSIRVLDDAEWSTLTRHFSVFYLFNCIAIQLKIINGGMIVNDEIGSRRQSYIRRLYLGICAKDVKVGLSLKGNNAH
jgi:hypothetical protein